MKVSIKKVISLLLMSVLVMSFVGCGKTNKEGNDLISKDTSSQSQNKKDNVDKKSIVDTDSYFPLAEQIQVTAVVPDQGRDRNTRVDQEIEKITNIKFTWQIIPGNYAEKVNTLLAAGDMPDIMPMCQPEFDKYYHQGMFVDFYEYLDIMPNLKKMAEKFPDMLDYFDRDGKLYAANFLTNRGQLGVKWSYRSDIFKKHNLKVPTTTTELYEVLKKLKELYPDSYPFYSDAYGIDGGILTTYQTGNNIYFNRNTLQYEYTPVTKNYMDALRFSRKLYMEGLVNPDFDVVTKDEVKANFIAEKGFVRHDWVDSIAEDLTEEKQINPDFDIDVFLPPVTETGLQGQVPLYYPTNNWWCITVNADSKYVEELVKFVDFQLGETMINLTNWGFEGETYTVKDGKKEFIVSSEVLSSMGIDGNSGVFSTKDDLARTARFPNSKMPGFFELYLNNAEKIGVAKEPKLNFTQEQKDKKTEIMSSLNTIMAELKIKFIKGEITEVEMEDMIQQIKDEGAYVEIVDMYNQEFEKIKDTYKLDYSVQ